MPNGILFWFEHLQCVSFDAYVEEIKNILNQDKEVCIVSPDLHKREYKKVWNIYRNINGIMLCTDYPMEAKEFFNVKN